MKRLLIVAALTMLPIPVLADAQENAVTVVAKRLEQDGQLTEITADDDLVKWLQEAIEAGKNRLAAELPSILGVQALTIELVSVPHPELESPLNKAFVQWRRESNPARFIPFVNRAISNKLDVFVALEARVSANGKSWAFSGQAHTQTEYTRGIQFSSAFLEALEGAGRTCFEEAIGNAIGEARRSSDTTIHTPTSVHAIAQ